VRIENGLPASGKSPAAHGCHAPAGRGGRKAARPVTGRPPVIVRRRAAASADGGREAFLMPFNHMLLKVLLSGAMLHSI
jgi:hypothetical protein